jgi:hypothetical protein
MVAIPIVKRLLEIIVGSPSFLFITPDFDIAGYRERGPNRPDSSGPLAGSSTEEV